MGEKDLWRGLDEGLVGERKEEGRIGEAYKKRSEEEIEKKSVEEEEGRLQYSKDDVGSGSIKGM